MTDAFLLDRDGAILTVTFNRPERLNAFRRTEYHALHELLRGVRSQPEVRVVLLTGSGRGFCAGEDLKEMDREAATEGTASLKANAEVLQDITRQMAEADQVFIAAVNGVAAGFGAELAIACDLRIGHATETRFLFPEVRRGLFITNGVSLLLPRIVGATWANTLLLTGQPIDAATAQRIGLVSHLVPGDELVGVARDMARAIAANAPTAVALTKRILRDGMREALEAHLAKEVESLVACIESGEHIEGARAFVEKRAPRWV